MTVPTRWLLLSALLAPLVAAPALACGSLHRPTPAVAAAGRCTGDALAGEWIAPDGARVRILAAGAGDRESTWLALRLPDDDRARELVYTGLRHVRDCDYVGYRHWQPAKGLHPAPPHAVSLRLDPALGELKDDYRVGTPLALRRAPR